jgi:hypothetical protein
MLNGIVFAGLVIGYVWIIKVLRDQARVAAEVKRFVEIRKIQLCVMLLMVSRDFSYQSESETDVMRRKKAETKLKAYVAVWMIRC